MWMSLIFVSFFLMNFACFRSVQQLPLILVATLPPGLTWESPTRLHSRFCSFLWHWSTMHQICPTARAFSSITARASFMIHRTIKDMLRDGPLRTRGGIPVSFNSYKQDSESLTPWACDTDKQTSEQSSKKASMRHLTEVLQYSNKRYCSTVNISVEIRYTQ